MNYMLIHHTIKEIILMAIKKEKGDLLGIMERFMMDNGTKERGMVVECGKPHQHRKNLILESGIMENLMDLVYS